MKQLAIIGGSYLQLPLINNCEEIGFESHCFSWEEGAVCKGIADQFYPPINRSGNRGVEKVLDPIQLEEAILRAQNESFEHKAIIEEFVTGREISVETISYKGNHHVLQIIDKVTTGVPLFVELKHHQPSSLPEDTKDKARSIVFHALDALHIQFGASHSELKNTEDSDLYVVEIGARMGGDFFGSDLDHEPRLTDNKYANVFFLCEETKDILPFIQHADKIPMIVRAGKTDQTLRKIESSIDRSGYLIGQSLKKNEISDLKRIASNWEGDSFELISGFWFQASSFGACSTNTTCRGGRRAA